jgi:hypothetical protein
VRRKHWQKSGKNVERVSMIGRDEDILRNNQPGNRTIELTDNPSYHLSSDWDNHRLIGTIYWF